MSKWNPYASDDQAEKFMRRAAKAEGLSFHEWCDKYGIVDGQMAQNIRRHEVPPLNQTDTSRDA